MMNPDKVCRERLGTLRDLPNVGPKIAALLVRLGIDRPRDLVGRDGFELYDAICCCDGMRYDPCLLDVFISITRFMNDESPRPWWEYTAERKRLYPDL